MISLAFSSAVQNCYKNNEKKSRIPLESLTEIFCYSYNFHSSFYSLQFRVKKKPKQLIIWVRVYGEQLCSRAAFLNKPRAKSDEI